MIIYRALKTNWLTQKFAVNKVFFDYGVYGLVGHNGVDWGCSYGEPIYFDCDIKGTVISTCNDATAGVGCDIITEDKDGIYKHTFWHFKVDGLVVNSGQTIESGDLIGYGDSTGMSTGNHLHRQLKLQGKDSLGRYYNLNQTNGYGGATDPMLFFKNIFIIDYMNLLKQEVSLLQQIIAKIKELLNIKVAK